MLLYLCFEEFFFSDEPKGVFQESALVKALLAKLVKWCLKLKKNSNRCRAFARDLIVLALPYHKLDFYNIKNGFLGTSRIWGFSEV